MATAYLIDDRLLLHDDATHPENAQRLRAISEALETSDLQHELTCLDGRFATLEEVAAVHRRQMLERTERLATFGGGELNPDTYLVPESWEVALLAAGTVVRAVEAVLAGEVSNAFALVRPPGHHATPSTAMGFCLINNVAVAARAARTQLGRDRIAIVDWDTHHGNGTQDIFYDDPDVLYISSHTYPFYPGTGHWREIGTDAGRGTTLNIPLPFYAGDETFVHVYEELVLRAVRRFAPQLIIVSSGYDCHWADPLAPMRMSVAGYIRLARMILALADEVCDGRLVLALEGGYNHEALAAGVVATLQVMRGRPELAHDPLGSQPEAQLDLQPLLSHMQQFHPLLT